MHHFMSLRISLLEFTCSKSATQKLEQNQNRNNKDTRKRLLKYYC